MITKMQFNCLNVKAFLQRFGYVFTVRGYDMKDKIVMVDDVGECKREKIKEIKNITELNDFVNGSGFMHVVSWWLAIGRFARENKKFLYKVEKVDTELEQAGDIIENVILDSYKRQGGIYKRAAEEYENDTLLCKQAKAELAHEEYDR